MTIVVTMVKLLLTMFVGFYLGRKNILDQITNGKLSEVVLQFTAPALAIAAVAKVQNSDPKTVIKLLIMGVFLYAITPFIGWLVARGLHVDKDLRGTYMNMIIFCNTAFMGYPVVQALFGDSAIFYTCILHMPFNIVFYTLGLYLFARDAGGETKIEAKNFINNGVIAAVIALIIYFTGVKLPDIIVEPISFVGNITMPLSMLIIGSTISRYSFREVFGNGKMYVLSFVRLAVMPAFTYIVAQFILDDPQIIAVATIIGGMPVAALVAMGPAEYEKQGEHGSLSVALTTLLSMLTVPIVAYLVMK